MTTKSALVDRLQGIRAKRDGISGIQVPLWPTDTRPLPNAAARGALFTAARYKDERRTYRTELVATTAQYRIHLSGEELRQFDQTVWLQLVHHGRATPAGQMIEATYYGILRSLGLTDTGGNLTRVRASIKRLVAATLWVSRRVDTDNAPMETDDSSDAIELPAEKAYRLIKEFETPGGRGARVPFRYMLDPTIVRLFAANDYSLVDWESRLKLTPMAQWAHSFYHSHARPVPYALETLRALSGAKSELRSFRTTMQNALEQLVAIGFLRDWRIHAGLVHVTRAARQG